MSFDIVSRHIFDMILWCVLVHFPNRINFERRTTQRKPFSGLSGLFPMTKIYHMKLKYHETSCRTPFYILDGCINQKKIIINLGLKKNRIFIYNWLLSPFFSNHFCVSAIVYYIRKAYILSCLICSSHSSKVDQNAKTKKKNTIYDLTI